MPSLASRFYATGDLYTPMANKTITTASYYGHNVWQDWNTLWTEQSTAITAWADWNTAATGGTYPGTAGTALNTGDTINIVLTWTSWNDDFGLALYNRGIRAQAQPLTPEQIAADEERRRQREIVEREARAKREAASVRARQLLLEHLTDDQRAEYTKCNYFTVISKTSRRRYRVMHGYAGNVHLLDDKGQPVRGHRDCCHPTGDVGVPTEDAMLAQKLMLEHDESGFLRLANVS